MGRLKRGASAEAAPSLRQGDTRRIVSSEMSVVMQIARLTARPSVLGARLTAVAISEGRGGERLPPP
jgi:hypothetical protein